VSEQQAFELFAESYLRPLQPRNMYIDDWTLGMLASNAAIFTYTLRSMQIFILSYNGSISQALLV
jgi:hypothetical protein